MGGTAALGLWPLQIRNAHHSHYPCLTEPLLAHTMACYMNLRGKPGQRAADTHGLGRYVDECLDSTSTRTS
jgi:hypothetical protein